MRRVRPQDVLLTALVDLRRLHAHHQLADIGFGTIADELRSADLAWVVVALILAQLTFVGSRDLASGERLEPLPLLPCVVLQSAIKFINLTVPSSAGPYRDEPPLPAADGSAHAGGGGGRSGGRRLRDRRPGRALLLLAIPFVRRDIDTSQFTRGPDGRLIAAIAIALAVSVTVMSGGPEAPSQGRAAVRSGCASLWRVTRTDGSDCELFGGNVVSELLYALALGATCHAYGVHLSLAQLILVNTGASVLSGFIPVPGGIGAAEATLTAGLVAMGVDESTAFAIALTQRLCTFYLPPIWGYFSLRWLSRKAYI